MIVMSDDSNVAGGDGDDGMKIILHAIFFCYGAALCCQCRSAAFVAYRTRSAWRQFKGPPAGGAQDTTSKLEVIDVLKVRVNLS